MATLLLSQNDSQTITDLLKKQVALASAGLFLFLEAGYLY